jgi:hypothetical protein
MFELHVRTCALRLSLLLGKIFFGELYYIYSIANVDTYWRDNYKLCTNKWFFFLTEFIGFKELLDSIPEEMRARWERLWMVSDKGDKLVHPLVYSHPVTGGPVSVFISHLFPLNTVG